MPLSAAEKQKRYRERLKNNKIKYEETKKKSRERYHKNKRLVKDLTPKERYNARMIWKLRKREAKKRNQAVEGLLQHTPPDSPTINVNDFNGTPPSSPIQSDVPPTSPMPDLQPSLPSDTQPIPSPDIRLTRPPSNLRRTLPRASPRLKVHTTSTRTYSRRSPIPNTPQAPAYISSPSVTPKLSAKERGRKKIRKDRSHAHRENVKLKQDIERLKRKYEKYKKRYQRSIEKKSAEDKQNEDPRYNILSTAIKESFKNTKSRKERAIIKKIFSNVVVENSRMKKQILIKNLGIDKIKKIKPSTKKETVLKKKIHDFFLRDDISRPTAGKKDTRTRAGIKVQKRFMLDTMKNLYKTFKKENPDLHCSYFYFTKNRPFYVISASVDAREMCLCKTHTNFAYKAKALKNSGIAVTDNLNVLIESTVCDTTLKACMYGICNQCATKKNTYRRENIKGTITWPEWIRKEETYMKDGKNLKAIKNVKEVKTEGAEAFVKRFEEDLAAFKKHVYNIKTQFQSFRRCLENIRPNECIVVADFSENYSCKYSQEVQSHHFGGSRKTISLHTVVVYTFDKDSAKGYTVNSFCSISASNNHQPAAIWSHLDPILKWVKSNFPDVDTVHFFSDGPSTQYRQKQNFYLMCTRFFDYGFVNITWSFFEAGHGKGPADGIGGFLKRSADRIVANGEDIGDVLQFYEKMKNVSKVMLYLIDEKDIEHQQRTLPKNIPRLIGTLKVHQVRSNCYGNLQYRDLSCFCDKAPVHATRGFCSCLHPKTYDIGISVHEAEDEDDGSTIDLTMTNASSRVKDLEREIFDSIAADFVLEQAETQPRQSMQATKDIEFESEDEEPLASLQVANQLRDLTNKHSQIYNEIYGSVSDDSLSMNNEPSASYDSNAKIGCGDFLLVKVYATKSKSYTYACKTLTDVEDDGEIRVMFLRVVDENAKRFRLDEKDISYVNYEDILKKLPVPDVVKRGHRSYYQFKESVDVFEKK